MAQENQAGSVAREKRGKQAHTPPTIQPIKKRRRGQADFPVGWVKVYQQALRQVVRNPTCSKLMLRVLLWLLAEQEYGRRGVVVRQGLIAEDLGVVPGAVSKALRDLEALGYVRHGVESHGYRAYWVHPELAHKGATPVKQPAPAD